MPPILALLISFGLTAWLIKRDRVPRPPMDFARWLVMLWLMIRASRPVTSWFGGTFGGANDIEGNQTEALIMVGFFVAAAVQLSRRGFNFSSIPRLHIFFFLLLLYFGLSCVWSAYPLSSFKRWSKEFGAVLVALVLVTDSRPIETLKLICIRSAFLLFPLSVALIKYFPHLGRAYSVSGQPMVTGVTDQKNSLGLISCIFCLALVWDIYDAKRRYGVKIFSATMRPQLFALGLGLWLLSDSQSKTSLIALILGLVLFFGTHNGLVRRKSAGFAMCVFGALGVTLAAIGTSTMIAAPLWEAVGRDATLTGRTEIWQAALAQPINPLIGCGYFIFWNEFGPAVWSNFQGNFYVRSAHSGYIETYLDGGYIACALLGFYLVSLGWRLSRHYTASWSFGRFAFALFIILLITNFSEAYILRLGSLWFLVVFITLAVAYFPRYLTEEVTPSPPRPLS